MNATTYLGVGDAVPCSPPLLPCLVPPLEARQAAEHVEAEREIHVAEQGRRHHQVREALHVVFVGQEHGDGDDDDGGDDDDINEQTGAGVVQQTPRGKQGSEKRFALYLEEERKWNTDQTADHWWIRCAQQRQSDKQIRINKRYFVCCPSVQKVSSHFLVRISLVFSIAWSSLLPAKAKFSPCCRGSDLFYYHVLLRTGDRPADLNSAQKKQKTTRCD